MSFHTNDVLAMKAQSWNKVVLCHSGTLVCILLKRDSKTWKSVVLGMPLWSLLCSLQKLTQLKIWKYPMIYPCYAERDQRERARFILFVMKSYDLLQRVMKWNHRTPFHEHFIGFHWSQIWSFQWWPGKCFPGNALLTSFDSVWWFHKRQMSTTSPSLCYHCVMSP